MPSSNPARVPNSEEVRDVLHRLRVAVGGQSYDEAGYHLQKVRALFDQLPAEEQQILLIEVRDVLDRSRENIVAARAVLRVQESQLRSAQCYGASSRPEASRTLDG